MWGVLRAELSIPSYPMGYIRVWLMAIGQGERALLRSWCLRVPPGEVRQLLPLLFVLGLLWGGDGPAEMPVGRRRMQQVTIHQPIRMWLRLSIHGLAPDVVALSWS